MFLLSVASTIPFSSLPREGTREDVGYAKGLRARAEARLHRHARQLTPSPNRPRPSHPPTRAQYLADAAARLRPGGAPGPPRLELVGRVRGRAGCGRAAVRPGAAHGAHGQPAHAPPAATCGPARGRQHVLQRVRASLHASEPLGTRLFLHVTDAGARKHRSSRAKSFVQKPRNGGSHENPTSDPNFSNFSASLALRTRFSAARS